MPINLTDPRFVNAYADTVEGQTKLGVSPQCIDDLPRLIEDKLNNIHNYLVGLAANPDYKTNSNRHGSQLARLERQAGGAYHLVADALNEDRRYELLGSFAASVAFFLARWFEEHTNSSTPPVTANHIQAFQQLPLNTMVKQVIDKRTQFFKDNLRTLCQRLCDDWDDINALFFPYSLLLKLTKIRTTGSDYHKKGQQVLILTFKVRETPAGTRSDFVVAVDTGKVSLLRQSQESEVKLIYKPSDVELDCRIIGDTDRLKARLPHIYQDNAPKGHRLHQFDSLIARINAALQDGHHPLQGSVDHLFMIPTYKILPRYPGSRLITDTNHRLPLDKSYGYLEFVSHEPPTPQDWQKIVLDTNESYRWDYVTKDPANKSGAFDLSLYYRIFGWYILLSLFLSFGDLHSENMIVNRKKPVLIDLEISFKHRANELAATLINWLFINQDPVKYKNTLLCYKHDGSIVTTLGNSAATHIQEGYNQAVNWFSTYPDVFRGWLTDKYMNLVVARYTPRRTAIFTANMRSCFTPPYSELTLPISPADYTRKPYHIFLHNDLYKWYEKNNQGLSGRPFFALATAEHDFACYHNGDAPAYYRRLGSLDLLNARGERVVVVQPQAKDVSIDKVVLNLDCYAKLKLPLQGNHDHYLQLEAQQAGNDGKKIFVEFLERQSSPSPTIINYTKNASNESIITISFGRDEKNNLLQPESSRVKYLINEHMQVKPHVKAAILPDEEQAGKDLCQLQPRIALGVPNQQLKIAGPSWFSYDPEGLPAAPAITIALERFDALVNNQNLIQDVHKNLSIKAIQQEFISSAMNLVMDSSRESHLKF